MEHRLSKRITTDLDLLVYKRGMPVATGKIRDASRKGLFILTDYTDVQLNQELEIELRFRLSAKRVRGWGGILRKWITMFSPFHPLCAGCTATGHPRLKTIPPRAGR